MSLNSHIEWTDATWNPVRSRYRVKEAIVSQRVLLVVMLALTLLIPGCQNRDQSTAARPSLAPQNKPADSETKPVAANSPADGWLGKWSGTEGTYILLTRNGDQFVVTIQSLDGVETYAGVVAED